MKHVPIILNKRICQYDMHNTTNLNEFYIYINEEITIFLQLLDFVIEDLKYSTPMLNCPLNFFFN